MTWRDVVRLGHSASSLSATRDHAHRRDSEARPPATRHATSTFTNDVPRAAAPRDDAPCRIRCERTLTVSGRSRNITVRPLCCNLESYLKRPKSSPVCLLACNWHYCAQFIAKPKAACALRFSWAATLSNLGL